MFAKSKTNTAFIVNPLFQLVCIIFTTLLMGCIIYRPIKEYHPLEQVDNCHKNYEKKGNATSAEIGMYIHHFLQTDIVKGYGTIDAMVWFAYDPSIFQPENFDNFFLKHSLVREKKLIHVKHVSSSCDIAYWHVVGHTTFALDYQTFPFDDHILSFHVVVPCEKINLIISPENFHVINDSALNGWHVINTDVQLACKEKMNKNELYENEVIFSAGINNSGHAAVMSLIVPLFILFFISLSSLSFSIEKGTDLSMNMVLAYVGFRFVIESLAPHVSYLTFCDKLFLYFLFTSLCLFILQSCHRYIAWYMRYIVLVGLHLGSILITYLLL